MSNNYNFDELTSNDEPTIKMGGFDYKLRYPTVEEIEHIQELKNDVDKTKAVYGFVYPAQEGTPPFETTLKKQSIKVLTAFTDMVKKEFGLEG